jgi:FG-GAP-like repeat/FG-GAP repeat
VHLLVLAAVLTFHPVDSGLPKSGMWRHGFAVADMNGDGRPDLVFTSPRKEPGPPRIFLNDGRGHFARWAEAKFPAMTFDYGAVAAADFDGNGTTDLAVGSHYIGVTVLLGDNRGTFTAVSDGFEYPSTFSSRALTAIDWNGDGRLDVAALSDGPRPLYAVQLGVTVFENLGSSWKTTRATTTDGIHGDAIAAGDVDGDGLGDLVTASAVAGDARVLRLGSDGALARREIETVLPVSVVRAVAAADFDGDGLDEIVIGYAATAPRAASLDVVAFPLRSTQLWMEEGATIEAVATGDLNGDGAIDIVAGLHDGRLLVFEGDRRVDIQPPAWRRGCPVSALHVADLDGDARAEIIATFAGEAGCPSGGGIEVWRSSDEPASRRRSTRH